MTLHTSTLRASYPVSIVKILEKLDCIIMAPHCISYEVSIVKILQKLDHIIMALHCIYNSICALDVFYAVLHHTAL